MLRPSRRRKWANLCVKVPHILARAPFVRGFIPRDVATAKQQAEKRHLRREQCVTFWRIAVAKVAQQRRKLSHSGEIMVMCACPFCRASSRVAIRHIHSSTHETHVDNLPRT